MPTRHDPLRRRGLAAGAAVLIGLAGPLPALAQTQAPAPTAPPRAPAAADDPAGEVLRSRGTPQGRAAAASRGAPGETPAPQPAAPPTAPAR